MSEPFTPLSGKLGQLVHESPDGGPRLECFLEITFRAAEEEEVDEDRAPLLRIDHVSAPGRSWRSLAGATVETGSVDAVMLHFAERNPAEIESIEFGALADGRLPVTLAAEVDFEVEAFRDDLGVVELSLEAFPLEIAPLRVSTALEKRCAGDPEAIAGEVGAFVDLDDYGPIEKAPGGFEFPARVG